MLVLAAEDYTGASPVKPGVTAPQYLSFYTNALAANGVAFDVYDVDAHGRTAPDNLGVLSHYDAVVWYTGDDVVTREPGWGPGNASRLAMQELLEVRDFVNEGGRVLYTGQRAGQQYTPGLGTQLYDPFENRQCRADPGRRWRAAWRCRARATRRATRSSTCSARRSRRSTAGSIPDTGDPFDVAGIDDPLAGLTWGFNGADSAQNQAIELVVHRDRRLPQGHRPGGQLPAVRELAGGRVPERPGGSVRPAHRAVVHVVQPRRRGVQAPDADDHGAGGRRDACRSGRASTSSWTSTT